MANKCDVCGTDHDRAFQVTMRGETYTFDSFECAIHMLADECACCGCRVLGHGIEADGMLYCCTHCALENRLSEMIENREPAGAQSAR